MMEKCECSAQAEVERLREDVEEYAPLLMRQGELLTRTVNAIKGDPPELTTWGHHNIPELAAALKAERDRLAGVVERVREWHDHTGYFPNKESLSAILDANVPEA